MDNTDLSLPPEIAPEIEEALERMVGAATSPMTLNLLWDKVRAHIKQQAARIRELEAMVDRRGMERAARLVCPDCRDGRPVHMDSGVPYHDYGGVHARTCRASEIWDALATEDSREGATKCHACGDYPRTHQSITMETRIHPGVNPCTAYTWVICRNRPKCRAALAEAVAQALEDARQPLT